MVHTAGGLGHLGDLDSAKGPVHRAECREAGKVELPNYRMKESFFSGPSPRPHN